MILINSDIEYLIITTLLMLLFFFGLEKRREAHLNFAKFVSSGGGRLLTIDFEFSQAIKGIACVMILMGHYHTYLLAHVDCEISLTCIEGRMIANIALFFFMFFSGYGLSLKDYSKHNILKDWLSRVKKIYYPLLTTCCMMLIIYAILPDINDVEYAKSFNVSNILHEVHNISSENILDIVFAGLGSGFWYVNCILIFYSLFYLSLYISRKKKSNQTVILSAFMLAYFFWAYWFFGEPAAHYYRYPWVFMLGHIVAKWNQNPKKLSLIVLGVLLLTEIPCGRFYHAYSIISLLILFIIAFINTAYRMNSRILFFMGSISYLYYLCHQKIACVLLAYTGTKSLLLWALATIPVTWGLSKIKKMVFRN